MMITNGTLEYKIKIGGGISDNGDPILVVDSWSDPIKALITPNSEGKLTKYQDGQVVVASYSILIELQEFDHSFIRITNDRGDFLGEYQVLKPNIRHLNLVKRVKITV
jgi:hypothetical protein